MLATFLGLHWDGHIDAGDAAVAVGTLSATIVAVYVGVIQGYLRRPHISLIHRDADQLDHVILSHRGHLIDWVRVRAVAKRGKRDAEDAEIIIVTARQAWPDSDGQEVFMPLDIVGHSLVWSNTDGSATRRIPAGATRYADLITSAKGRPPQVRLQLAPRPTEDRDQVIARAVELDVLLTARDADPRKYLIRIDHTHDAWTDDSRSKIKVTLTHRRR